MNEFHEAGRCFRSPNNLRSPGLRLPVCCLFMVVLLSLAGVIQAQEDSSHDKKRVEVQPDKNQKLMLAGGQEFSQSQGGGEVVELEEGKRAVQIHFDLSDGVYFSVGYPLDLKREFKSLSFRAQTEVECGFAVRLIDQSGECFQFKFDNEKPGKKQECEADLTRENVECWGGDGNKKLDQPIKAIHFLVSRRGTEGTKGSAVFSEVVFRR